MTQHKMLVPFKPHQMGDNYHLVSYVCYYNESPEEMIDMLLREVTDALELEEYWEDSIVTTYIVVHQWLSFRYLDLVASGQKHEDFHFIVDLTQEEAIEIYNIEAETGEMSVFTEDVMDYYSYNMSYIAASDDIYNQIYNGEVTESIESALVEAVTRLRIRRGDFIIFRNGCVANPPVKNVW